MPMNMAFVRQPPTAPEMELIPENAAAESAGR